MITHWQKVLGEHDVVGPIEVPIFMCVCMYVCIYIAQAKETNVYHGNVSHCIVSIVVIW